jgi:glycosyltransferase involved in cell wall biosynthesis
MRIKHCCGSMGAASTAMHVDPLHAALSCQKAGRLADAERLYKEALSITPEDPNALDMLGVICFTELRYQEALHFGFRAARATQWRVSQIRHNLALTCGRLLGAQSNRLRSESLREFILWRNAQVKRTPPDSLVSVVIPSYNHAAYLRQALESVFAQTYRNIELVVIDDGSSDGSAPLLERLLERCPFPAKWVARENRGAPATINEGIGLARGDYINILNSDDYFAPNRIARMLEEVASRNVAWGFSKVALFPTGGDASLGFTAGQARIQAQVESAAHILGKTSNSMSFVEFNSAISTGNLFFHRDLYQRLGGFRNYKYNHDWDFCLRASCLAEPWYVDEPLYFYRVHHSNTILGSGSAALAEVIEIFHDVLFSEQADASIEPNPLSPVSDRYKALTHGMVLHSGANSVMPIDRLKAIVDALVQAHPPAPLESSSISAPDPERKVAIVVLGMHRSGTSAMSRVLNLAGAQLPDNLRPAKLGNNERGFWEPEEVVQLNEWLLAALKGSWMRPPDSAKLSDDLRATFLRAATNLLDAEYKRASLILLKDPRICLFIEPWHMALESAGYDVRYVHVIRPPSEVAKSLLARDAMPEDMAAGLWLHYNQEAERATRTHLRVFVAYHDLLDDWTRELRRISATLRIPLDLDRCADGIASFLSRDLHHHRAATAAPDTTGVLQKARGYYEHLDGLGTVDTLRKRRILVAAIGLSPNGGLFRFARVARLLRQDGHEVCFANLGHMEHAAFHEFPILDLASAQKRQWDATVLPGAGFPSDAMHIFQSLSSTGFGKRILAILNDTSRREKYLAAASHFRPHALLFNNRHWQESDLTGALDLPARWIVGAVDTQVFAPDADMPRADATRVGLQAKTLPDILPLIQDFPEIQQWHVFGVPPERLSLPPELGNRLFFHGILNDQQLCRFYNKVDVVIAAEHHAGWCNVAAEAMACGRPVICTAAGTLDFAVNGVNALVVPSVTATHLGHALRVLMTSFDLRSKLSENGPAAVAAMDWHRWAGDFLSFCLADEAGNTRRNRSNTLPNVQELR